MLSNTCFHEILTFEFSKKEVIHVPVPFTFTTGRIPQIRSVCLHKVKPV